MHGEHDLAAIHGGHENLHRAAEDDVHRGALIPGVEDVGMRAVGHRAQEPREVAQHLGRHIAEQHDPLKQQAWFGTTGPGDVGGFSHGTLADVVGKSKR